MIDGEAVLLRKLFLSSPVLFVLLSFSIIVTVEADSLMWTQTYGGTNDDQAYSLVETSDGGYAIVGYARSFGAGRQDFWLVKTDTFGFMEWNKTYGGTNDDQAYSLVATSDGGYAMAGETLSFGAQEGDCWLVKTDGSGNVEWNHTYGGTGDDVARSLVETSDGGYAVAGTTGSYGAGDEDFWLIKTDGVGDVEWNQTYGGIGDDVARSLVATSDGGYALAGYTYSFGAGNEDFWLVKTDEYGNIEWNQTYGGGSHDVARSLIETSDGGYALTGFTQSFGNGQAHCWLVKTDATGNMQWNYTYGKIDTTYAFALVETSDGGYHLAGGIYYDDVGTEFLLIKTDGFGIMEWNQTYGGMGHEQAHALVATSDGGYAIAGETNSYGAGSNDSWSYDFWLIKTDEYGVIPEYSSWLIPSIFLVATLVIVIWKKKLLNPHS